MRKLLKIGSYSFPSKSSAIQTTRKILHRYDLKSPLTIEEDARFLTTLFACHPDYTDKTAGRTIARFEVHPNKGGTRCFYAVFAEGGMIDFSYKLAIEGAARMG
jgi:hypothetical protein